MDALAICCFILAACGFITGAALLPFVQDPDPATPRNTYAPWRPSSPLVTACFASGLTALLCGLFFGALGAM